MQVRIIYRIEGHGVMAEGIHDDPSVMSIAEQREVTLAQMQSLENQGVVSNVTEAHGEIRLTQFSQVFGRAIEWRISFRPAKRKK